MDSELILFGAVVCDVIWKARNQAQFEGMSPNVDSLIQKISNSISEHRRFKATLVRTQTSCYSNVWAKPVRPQIKFNVDAACNFGRAAIAAIARDWRGEVVFACSKPPSLSKQKQKLSNEPAI